MTASSPVSRLSREQVEKLILDARVKAGWIDEAALEPSPKRPKAEASTEDAKLRPETPPQAARAPNDGVGDISLAASGGGAGAR